MVVEMSCVLLYFFVRLNAVEERALDAEEPFASSSSSSSFLFFFTVFLFLFLFCFLILLFYLIHIFIFLLSHSSSLPPSTLLHPCLFLLPLFFTPLTPSPSPFPSPSSFSLPLPLLFFPPLAPSPFSSLPPHTTTPLSLPLSATPSPPARTVELRVPSWYVNGATNPAAVLFLCLLRENSPRFGPIL